MTMRISEIVRALIAAGCLVPAAALAQFSGLVTLPQNDFLWRWGDAEEVANRRFEDFSASGTEGGFRCDLTGRMTVSNPMTPGELRNFEQQLRSSIYFIQQAAYAMNELDRLHRLDWAELSCVKPQPTDEDAQEVQERVDRARERAVQEMLERRARREQ